MRNLRVDPLCAHRKASRLRMQTVLSITAIPDVLPGM